ncbi:Ferroporti-1 [Rhexocercosporidium sp. MPI-PUGE-AT-0058]|nr:Ferroporti-1 [Rhexocercosporidium sp. MPI-PUGE-AT-0058]
MSRSQAYNLYASHFLSTWNVRTYEFAAIIFTASAYPDTLVAAAIRGIIRTLASVCFSSMVGRWVDRNPNRLKTLLSTISANRLAVISASILWFFIVTPNTSPPSLTPLNNNETISSPTHFFLKGGIFTLILLLGILEALSASGNMLSMERDWVITAASPAGHAYDLTHLNSVMRRIDLICKLIAPILISIIISATSPRMGVLVVGAMSAASWAVETFCARRVWDRIPRLQQLKISQVGGELDIQVLSPVGAVNRLFRGLHRYAQDFKMYFSSTVCIPSLALALLHLSALSYSATFITFLLSTGFSLQLITIARAAGSVVEISSTVVTPVGVQYLGKARNHGRFRGRDVLGEGDGETLLGLGLDEHGADDREGRTETGLERLGLWGISWQLLNLIPVVFALWSVSPTSPSSPETGPGPTLPNILTHIIPHPSPPLLAFALFTFLSLSRLGLWIYDLTTQQLTQTLTSPSSRSSFTGVEYSFVSLFELLQNIMTLVLSHPQDFRWIALVSLLAVGASTAMYAAWVSRMRGHLVHWERLGKGCECVVGRESMAWRMRGWAGGRR